MSKKIGLAPAVDRLSFEAAMRELDTIVEQMEDGSLSLEHSFAAYKRGAELVKHCQTALQSVRDQVQVLDGDMLKPMPEFNSALNDQQDDEHQDV